MGRNDTDRDLMIKHLNVWTNKIIIKCHKIGLLPSFKTFSLNFNLFKIYMSKIGLPSTMYVCQGVVITNLKINMTQNLNHYQFLLKAVH